MHLAPWRCAPPPVKEHAEGLRLGAGERSTQRRRYEAEVVPVQIEAGSAADRAGELACIWQSLAGELACIWQSTGEAPARGGAGA